MIEILIIIVITIIAVIEGVIIRRKVVQNDKYQEILELYENWIENFALTVEAIDTELDKLDSDGTFRSDDEVGFFFQAMYSILKRLSDYGLTDEPEQIPGAAEMGEMDEQGKNVLYTRDRERIKRIKKRRNENIKMEDIKKIIK